MPISFELANANSLRFPGVQARVKEYVLTVGRLPKQADPTQGLLYKDAVAAGCKPVYVVSDIYFPTDSEGAINLLWRGRYYRVGFDLPVKAGSANAYIARRLCEIGTAEAMGRAVAEHADNRRTPKGGNALIATSAQSADPLAHYVQPLAHVGPVPSSNYMQPVVKVGATSPASDYMQPVVKFPG